MAERREVSKNIVPFYLKFTVSAFKGAATVSQQYWNEPLNAFYFNSNTKCLLRSMKLEFLL